jgi:prevent-host-death family protein
MITVPAKPKPTKTVGAYEAKTRLSELLDLVERGRIIVITRHARNVARLIPDRQPGVDPAIFTRIRALRSKLTLPKGETTKDLINAGRRI